MFSSLVTAENIIATGNVFVRESPPNGLFCSKGKDLGVLKSGDSVKLIREVKAVCGLFFQYKFYLIEYTDKTGAAHEAYVSSVDSDGTELFRKGQ